ncbi:MAG: HAD family hydrolase [Hyphomicrobium sp.]
MAERMSGRGTRDKPQASRREPDAPARAAGSPQGESHAPNKSPVRSAQSKYLPTKKTIALVYDFDGTLSPKPMQEYSFLPALGIKAADFWAECTRLARTENADPLITYMHLMYKKAKEKGLRVDRKDLVAQGRDVELYPGVEAWFGKIEKYVATHAGADGVTIKHYLVSSGLTEIIEGTKIYKNFANVFASEYWFDAYDMPFPKRVITDTGKTQYLFRINKGLENQFESINTHMPEAARPIPFSNMIYFGDGETDVPSMALLKKNGGHAIAVHDLAHPAGSTPGESDAQKSASRPDAREQRASGKSGQAALAAKDSAAMHAAAHLGLEKCIELFRAGRCDFYAPADYRAGSELFKRTTLLLDRILADIRVEEERARLG